MELPKLNPTMKSTGYKLLFYEFHKSIIIMYIIKNNNYYISPNMQDPMIKMTIMFYN